MDTGPFEDVFPMENGNIPAMLAYQRVLKSLLLQNTTPTSPDFTKSKLLARQVVLAYVLADLLDLPKASARSPEKMETKKNGDFFKDRIRVVVQKSPIFLEKFRVKKTSKDLTDFL